MNNATHYFRVGLFFLLGLALIWITYETLSGSISRSSKGYAINASFNDLKQLKSGDDVRLAGVRIGTVKSTLLRDGRAVAILDIESTYDIPVDSEATITTAGLLGSNYVSIQYGRSREHLRDGSQIATRTTPDINDVLAQIGQIGDRMDALLVSVEQAMGGGEGAEGPASMFRNLNALITANREKLDATFTHLATITDNLANGKGTLGKLINDDDMYTRLLGMTEDFSNFTGKIESSEGALGLLMNDKAFAESLRQTMQNVEAFSVRLNSDSSTLGRLISSDDLYLQAQGTLRKVNQAVDSVNDSGPITAVGIATNALF